MSVLKGDFIGFTYNGIHSSDLGIVRTSNGSRFDENLLPTIQDKTAQIPGGDGTYYFGSYYTQRQFNVSFAFDSLSESQIEFLRMHFGDKQIHTLVFDESPYKSYQAKVTGTATIKHIPFDAKEGRIYKGEGTIQFTCYQPFAICKNKYLSYYRNKGINVSDWSVASGLLEDKGVYDSDPIDSGNEYFINLYNPGVKEADWILTVKASNAQFPSGALSIGSNSLVFQGGPVKTKNARTDTKITFNSKTGLVEGWYEIGDESFKTGNIYNDYITAGDFFKIPVNVIRGPRGVTMGDEIKFFIGKTMRNDFMSLDYDYYYF